MKTYYTILIGVLSGLLALMAGITYGLHLWLEVPYWKAFTIVFVTSIIMRTVSAMIEFFLKQK